MHSLSSWSHQTALLAGVYYTLISKVKAFGEHVKPFRDGAIGVPDQIRGYLLSLHLERTTGTLVSPMRSSNSRGRHILISLSPILFKACTCCPVQHASVHRFIILDIHFIKKNVFLTISASPLRFPVKGTVTVK